MEFDHLLMAALAGSALACAYPLRKIFQRAHPLGLAGKFFAFVLVLLLWFSGLAPLAVIFNVKFDSSAPEHYQRKVLEARERGPHVCLVNVQEWKNGEGEHWLWLECETVKKAGEAVTYDLRRGALGFAWVSSNLSGM